LVFKFPNVYGYNTDCSAAVESVSKTLEGHKDVELEGARVLILGSGGVARAIAFGLKRAKAKVTICARDYRKADALATALDCEPIDWPSRANFEADVLINCTPVGMYPDMDVTPFDEEWFDKKCLVFDTVYNPEQTLFIKQARKAGCTTITGVDMFVRQAAKQFKLFTGEKPDVKLIRYEVKRAISAAKY
jgi:3-dehydroquinate dehydratase/shikimate dehydrogenase